MWQCEGFRQVELFLAEASGDERADFERIFARYGDADDVARAAGDSAQPVGAVLVEPVQGRGGERIPPRGFLEKLKDLFD